MTVTCWGPWCSWSNNTYTSSWASAMSELTVWWSQWSPIGTWVCLANSGNGYRDYVSHTRSSPTCACLELTACRCEGQNCVPTHSVVSRAQVLAVVEGMAIWRMHVWSSYTWCRTLLIWIQVQYSCNPHLQLQQWSCGLCENSESEFKCRVWEATCQQLFSPWLNWGPVVCANCSVILCVCVCPFHYSCQLQSSMNFHHPLEQSDLIVLCYMDCYLSWGLATWGISLLWLAAVSVQTISSVGAALAGWDWRHEECSGNMFCLFHWFAWSSFPIEHLLYLPGVSRHWH